MKRVLFIIGIVLLNMQMALAQKQWTLQDCIDSAADSERIDKPESGLSALEGFGYVVCDQRHREYEGGQDLL